MTSAVRSLPMAGIGRGDAAENNTREADTPNQMRTLVERMDGKRLRHLELIAPNRLNSGARRV